MEGYAPPAMSGLFDLTALEISRRCASGSLSSSEIVEALLERTDRLEGAVGAWVTIDEDGARGAAGSRDEEARAGDSQGLLHGVPVGVKDIYHVAGLLTTAG